MKSTHKFLATVAVSLITFGSALTATAATAQPEGLQGVVAAERYRGAQEGAVAIKLHAVTPAAQAAREAAGRDVAGANLESQLRVRGDNTEAQLRVRGDNVESQLRVRGDNVESQLRVRGDNVESQLRVRGDNVESQLRVRGDNIESQLRVRGDSVASELRARI